jgi:hypothetical protein
MKTSDEHGATPLLIPRAAVLEGYQKRDDAGGSDASTGRYLGGSVLKLRMRGIRENLAGVIGWVHLSIDNRDLSLLIDEVADTRGISCADIAASAISQSNFAVGVAQQFEWETVLAGKRSVRGDIVEADAENDHAGVFESTVMVAEPATLAGSASGIGLGIKPQENLAST